MLKVIKHQWEQAIVHVFGDVSARQATDADVDFSSLAVDPQVPQFSSVIKPVPGPSIGRDERQQIVARLEPLAVEVEMGEPPVQTPLDLEGAIDDGQDFEARGMIDRELAESLGQPDGCPDLDGAGGPSDEVDHRLNLRRDGMAVLLSP